MQPYDLHERTALFARDIRIFLSKLPKNLLNTDDCRQLLRSSGSVGANYIEANDNLGEKDMLFRFRITRKEAKESSFWLTLINTQNDKELENERRRLHAESIEIIKIFSSIINKKCR